MTLQCYSAIHVASLIVLATCVSVAQFVGVVPVSWSVGVDDFNSLLGKVLVSMAILYAIIPAFINFFAMLGDMITRGRWAWLVVTLILTFGATAVYYFSEYRSEKDGI